MRTIAVFFITAACVFGVSAGRGTPVIDGVLDDAVWAGAERNNGFTKLGTGAPASVKTSFSVLHDEANIYVGIACFQPMNPVAAKAGGRDSSAVFSDDSAEVFINTLATASDVQVVRFFQIAVSASGAYYDVAKRKGDLGAVLEDVSWNPDVRIRTVRGSDRWTAEMAIPYSQLAFDGPHPAYITMNVTRNWQGEKPTEWSTWTKFSKKSFNVPEEFQRIEWVSPAMTHYLWDVKSASLAGVERTADGYAVSVAADIINRSGLDAEVSVRITGANGSAVEQTVRMSGTESRIALPLTVKAEGVYDLEVFGYSPAEKKELFYYAKGKNRVYYSLVDMTVTSPSYRDSIFSDERIGAVTGVIDVNLDDARLKEHAVRLELRRGTERIYQNTSDITLRRTAFSVPVPGLAEGDYTLAADVLKKGAVVGSTVRTIRKLPRLQGEVRYDVKRNCMLVDGKPFIPIGWYGAGETEADFPYLTNTSFNMLYNGVAMWQGAKGTKAYLDEAEKHGLKFMTWIYPNDKIMKEKLRGVDKPSKEVKDEIAAFIAAVKDHPALLGWYIADEPEYNNLKPSCLEELYQHVRDIDPHHPVVMLNCTAPAISDYRNCGDILMPDPYPPFFKGKFDTQVNIEKVAEFVSIAREVNAQRGPAWVTPEAFSYANEFTFRDRRFPTYVEERSMTMLSLVHGASGFCYFSFPQHYNSSELFVGMPYIARELAALAPIIADGERSMLTASVKQVNAAQWIYNGQRYIIAVHTRDVPVDASIPVAGAGDVPWHVVSEGRTIGVKGGVLTDRFGTAETHIYTTDASFAVLTDMRVVKKGIASFSASLAKQGNIAYRADVTASLPKETSPDVFTFVTDGVTHPRSQGITFRGQPSADKPQRVEVMFGQKRTIDKAVIHALLPAFVWAPPTPYMFDYKLSYYNGSGYAVIANGTAAAAVTEAVFPAVQTDRVRIEFMKNRGRVDLVELEVYGK